MKKILITFITILVALSLSATNYYIKTGGNDSNTGLSDAQAWATVSKVNAVFSAGTFNPGDSILFKRGDTFIGNLVVRESGTSGNNIVIGAYGPSNVAKPIITGLQTVSGWTNVGGYIWESSATACKSTLNLVVVDGKIAQIGRYPNAGTMLSYESYSGVVSITDNQLPATPNWTGAEIYIRNNNYGGQRRTITDHTGTTITYAGGNNYDMKNGYGYFIQNDVRTLDADKEWFFNTSTKKISMYFADNNPALHTIKASIYDTIALSTDKNYITFVNLQLQGGNEANLDMNGTSLGCKVLNCDMNYAGTYGVYLGTTSDFLFSGNTVTNALSKGILANQPNSQSIFEYNTIRRIGLLMGMNRTFQSYVGFEVNGGDGKIIRYNVVDSVGFHGIFPRGSNGLVEKNLITNFGLVLDDCGGIYLQTTQPGNQILNNVVLYGIGNLLGAGSSVISTTNGIYMDNVSSNTYVAGNTTAFCGYCGIMYHNAYNMTLRNNTTFDNPYGIQFIKGVSDVTYNRDLTVRNNIMVAKKATQYAFRVYTYVTDDPLLFGTADSNAYCRPTAEGTTIQTRNVSTIVNYNLTSWKATGNDANSNSSPITLSSSDDILFDYNASQTNKIVRFYGMKYYDAKGNVYLNSITLQPYTSAVLFKDTGYVFNSTLLKRNNIILKRGTNLLYK